MSGFAMSISPLACVLHMFHHGLMEQIDSQQLKEAILTAPAWARIGITVRDPRMREKAATELANTIVERLTDYPGLPDPDQLSLFS
jgi:hypothetical protein